MTKRTVLIRSTLASLITGLFLAPVVHAAGIEIRENQDFAAHMVPADQAVAPGAKAQKQKAAPAPAQKMRITANGVVPEDDGSTADTVAAAPAAKADNQAADKNAAKPSAAPAPVSVKAPAVAQATPAAAPAETPAKEKHKNSNVVVTDSNIDSVTNKSAVKETAVKETAAAENAATKAPAKAEPAQTPIRITAAPEVSASAGVQQATALQSGPAVTGKADKKAGPEAASTRKSVAQHTPESAIKSPAKQDAKKTTAEVKKAAVASTPVAVETAAPSEGGKAELADGLNMRITATGIIPESEYELQLPQEDISLADTEATKDAKDDDIATKARKALSGTGKPYMVKGIRYKPMGVEETTNFSQVGIASWYGPGFHGRKTANGEVYNQNAMTAAHKRLPISSYVRVTRVSTGKSIVVRINDRGPFVGNRVIDLSYGAAKRLGIVNRGSDKVKIEPISKEAAAGERNTETQVKAKKML